MAPHLFFYSLSFKLLTMKKHLFLVLTTSFLTGYLNAQVEIRLGNTGSSSDISGTEHVEIVSSDQLVSVVFQIKNTSGASHNYTIRRDRLIEMPVWTDYFCWAVCYPESNMNINSWTAPDPLAIASNGTQLLMVDTDTHGSGTELYRYYVINHDNSTLQDSIDVRITSVLSVNDQHQEEIAIAVYPNPVANSLTIAANGVDGVFDIKMTDVLGKVILNESSNQTKKVVDVSNFKNGVYLVSVFSKGELVQTRRVVIKH